MVNLAGVQLSSRARAAHEQRDERLDFIVSPTDCDAHLPPFIGHGFAEAAQRAEGQGFRPGRKRTICGGELPDGRWTT